VDQQVAHLHLARDPGVVHAEIRQVFHDRIVPLELALVDEPSEHAGGHGLGVGGDLEQRVVVDRAAAAGDEFAGRADVGDLAVFHDTDRQAGQVVTNNSLIEGGIKCCFRLERFSTPRICSQQPTA
jgi:hypothetical protein